MFNTTDHAYGNISISVVEWKISAIDKNVTNYVIEVSKRDLDKWVLEKRFSEFNDLYLNLKKLFSGLPDIPGKTIFKVTDKEELDKR